MAEEYDKLVRDQIPRIIEENAENPEIHIAEGNEYTERLVEKLDEEVAEYRESRQIDELVDILEVVHAIRKDKGVTAEELQEKRMQKANQRGRFDNRVILEQVED